MIQMRTVGLLERVKAAQIPRHRKIVAVKRAKALRLPEDMEQEMLDVVLAYSQKLVTGGQIARELKLKDATGISAKLGSRLMKAVRLGQLEIVDRRQAS